MKKRRNQSPFHLKSTKDEKAQHPTMPIRKTVTMTTNSSQQNQKTTSKRTEKSTSPDKPKIGVLRLSDQHNDLSVNDYGQYTIAAQLSQKSRSKAAPVAGQAHRPLRGTPDSYSMQSIDSIDREHIKKSMLARGN